MSVLAKFAEQVKAFMGTSMCLIVEPSLSFSSSIHVCLTELGVPGSQITTCKRFKDARRLIGERKPKLLVTEYDLPGKQFGIALTEMQETIYPERERIAILVTKNSSDSAIAQAAEGAIDAFLLKPFSVEVFRKKLVEVLIQKMDPSPYAQTLESGRQKLSQNDIGGALADFQTAKTMYGKPTLACYQAGMAYIALGERDKALAEFREGRKHQPLHYKCLTAEFDELIQLKRYPEAFELIPLINSNYPVNAQRLGQMFAASVFAQKFESLNEFYDIFVRLDSRNPRLVELASVALLTAGRFALQNRDLPTALAHFEKGLVVCARELSFLNKIVDELLNAGAVPEALAFADKALPSDIGTPQLAHLRFKIDHRRLPADQLIDRGRKIVADGQATPDIFRILVDTMVKAGKTTLAETIIIRALEKHPEMKSELYQILEGSSKPLV